MHEKRFHSAKFLVVDDEFANVCLLEQMLQACDCHCVKTTTDPTQVYALYKSFQPDIILLDLMMPEMDGFEVMRQLKPLIPPEVYLPILVLTADIAPEVKSQALTAGAKDFLTKPFDVNELLLRIWNLLDTRFLHLQLQNQNGVLEQRVLERTSELEAAHSSILKYMKEVEASQFEILSRLARAAEFRDDDTGRHTQRVGLAAALLARQIGWSIEDIGMVQRAAPLHDVGKIGISDLILLKPGRLTQEEYVVMQTHAQVGASLLAGGRSELVQMAERIALTHHERWDGTGYPHGLKGEEIPIEGRILAVVDVFDALTHERPYKPAWRMEDALAEIRAQSGHQFDPTLVDAFLSLPHEVWV
jgi:putative two-component system response regulator